MLPDPTHLLESKMREALGVGMDVVADDIGAIYKMHGLKGRRHGGRRELAEKMGEGGGGLEAGRTMVRVDGDTMRTAKDYFGVLERFSRAEIKVLLGTQMIAKGLDYPNVTLVGVISGDTALALPDFRAAERTFQLITQVAGRAGRGDKPGRVILQSMTLERLRHELAPAEHRGAGQENNPLSALASGNLGSFFRSDD